jgi:LmbE family N-acetylglucosaminyl deacetylase
MGESKSHGKSSPAAEGRRLLAVFAHPDDESFGPGGTLALYAQRGVAVHLICATRGEAGIQPPRGLQGKCSIGELREAELRCAASQLGLSAIHLLGYRDSGMPGASDNQHPQALCRAPRQEVAHQISRLMHAIQPQVVITFDPIGGYFHPDHIAIHQATLQAFHMVRIESRRQGLSALLPAKLYYHTLPHRFLRLGVKALALLGRNPRQWGRNSDIDLVAIAGQEYPIHARIDIRTAAKAKRLAASCHASQGAPPSGGVMGWLLRLGDRTETFMRAFPPPSPRLQENDLFEGLP